MCTKRSSFLVFWILEHVQVVTGRWHNLGAAAGRQRLFPHAGVALRAAVHEHGALRMVGASLEQNKTRGENACHSRSNAPWPTEDTAQERAHATWQIKLSHLCAGVQWRGGAPSRLANLVALASILHQTIRHYTRCVGLAPLTSQGTECPLHSKLSGRAGGQGG